MNISHISLPHRIEFCIDTPNVYLYFNMKYNQFDQYVREEEEIYRPLLSDLNLGVEAYFDLLENYLIREQSTIIRVGRKSEEDISYIVNYACHILINHINQYKFDAEIKLEYILFLNKLLNVLKAARETPLGQYLNPFFERKVLKEDTRITVPSHYELIEKLVITYREKFEPKSPYFVSNEEKKQLSRKITSFYPIYDQVLGYGSNGQFREKFTREKRNKAKEYTNNLYKFMRGQLSGIQEGDYNGFTLATKVDIEPVKNPSQLDPDDLLKSFSFFAEGRKRNPESIGQRILLVTPPEMRWQINKCIIELLPERYSQSFFGQRLLAKLNEIFPNNIEAKKVPNAIVRLISFLTIEADRNHYQLVNLLSNVGSKKVLSILTTLAKLYPEAGLKEEIDKRLAMLFKHYGDYPESEVQWLIRLLENYNLASSILFEKMDIDGLQKLIERDKNRIKDKV